MQDELIGNRDRDGSSSSVLSASMIVSFLPSIDLFIYSFATNQRQQKPQNSLHWEARLSKAINLQPLQYSSSMADGYYSCKEGMCMLHEWPWYIGSSTDVDT